MQAGVENFVFVSAAGSQQIHILLKGYWKGKQKAEEAVMQGFVKQWTSMAILEERKRCTATL